MTNAELLAKFRAEIDKLYGEYKDKFHQCGDQYHLGLIDGLDMAEQVLDTLESEHLADARKTSPNDLDFENELYNHFGQVKDFTLGMRIGQYFYELGCRRTAEKYDEIEYNRQRAEEHLASIGKTSPKDLEEAARKYAHCPFTDDDGNFHEDAIDKDAYLDFIAGAKWQADHIPLPEDTVLFYKGVEEGKRLMMEEMSECLAQLKQVQSESINMSAVREQLAYNRGASDERYKMRKKMMEEAVEGKIVSKNDGWNSIELPSTFFGELSKNFNHGDKVRIIIVKED